MERGRGQEIGGNGSFCALRIINGAAACSRTGVRQCRWHYMWFALRSPVYDFLHSASTGHNGSLSQICTESETLVALSATFLPLFQRPGLLFQFSHRKNQERARSGVNHTIHGLFGNWVFPELEITNSFKIIQNAGRKQAIYDKLKAMSRVDLAL